MIHPYTTMKKNQENQHPNESVQMMDENSRTHRQTQHLTTGKGIEVAVDGPDVIATRTRAALKRNALGDLSNIQSAQIPVLPVGKVTRTTTASIKSKMVGTTSHANASVNASASATVDVSLMATVTKEERVTQLTTDVHPLESKLQDWDDLDSEDKDDPSMVTEYVNEIFHYLREIEGRQLPDMDYMSKQAEITWKMRSVLVDWLVEIHWKLKLLPETLFLAVNLMDRFLSLRAVSLAKFQLVGVASTLIASKYEEVLSPSVSNFVYLSDGSYDDQEILKAECYMLNSLQFNLSYPNPYVFLRRISKADDYDIQTRTLAKYFLESALLDNVFLQFAPSMMATASIYLARKMLHRGEWSANLAHYSGYDAASLMPSVKELLAFYQRPLKYEAVYKKYSSRKFMKASIFVKEYMIKYYPMTNATVPAA